MNRILTISLIIFAIIILANTVVSATGIDMNLSSNTTNTTNTTNNANTTNTTNNTNVVDDTVLGGNINSTENTTNQTNVAGTKQELSQGTMQSPTSSAALSSSTLGISNIINIILIVLGVLLILLGIAILIRLR